MESSRMDCCFKKHQKIHKFEKKNQIIYMCIYTVSVEIVGSIALQKTRFCCQNIVFPVGVE